MNNVRQIAKYVLSDWLAAAVAWTALYVYRKMYLEPVKFGDDVRLEFDTNFSLGLAIVPMFWLLLYDGLHCWSAYYLFCIAARRRD